MPWTHIRIFLVIMGVVLFFVALSFAQELNRRWQYEQEVAQLHEEASALERKVVELEHLNNYFRTDEYKERLAREKLNYKAPNEKVVLVPQDQQQSATTLSEDVSSLQNPTSNPLRWWHSLFVKPYL